MSSTHFDTLLEEADGYARAGQWQETFDRLTEAAAEEPQHAGVVTGLGTCLIKLGRLDEALAYFQKAAQLAPLSPEAHNNVGVTYALLGQVSAAEAAYRKALECDSEHVPAWKNLAQLYMQQGRIDEGVPILATLVKKHPDDWEALTLMAACYEDGEDTESARTPYREALKYQPDNAAAKAGLARLSPPPADLTHIARPEHAKKLAALKNLSTLKPGAPPSPKV